jgi:hypothetical protein
MPRWIILTYGSDINGLTATIIQILSIINLLQAGMLGASLYMMYKPIAERDYKTVSIVLASSKKYFTRLGLIFIAIVLLVTPIVSCVLANQELSFIEIALSMLILSIGSVNVFMFIAWYDVLFSSHQFNHYMSIGSIVDKVVYYGLLVIVLSLKLNFIFMYVAVVMGNITKVLVLYLIYKKTLADKLVEVSEEELVPIKNAGYLMTQQICTQGIESSTTLLITFMSGLSSASVYSVYCIPRNFFVSFISYVYYAVGGSFGNVVNSEKGEKTNEIFNVMQFVFIVSGTWAAACCAFLYVPFVRLYTQGVINVDYIQPVLAIVLVMDIISHCIFYPYHILSGVYGIFKETYKAAVIFGIIGVIISAVLGMINYTLIPLGVVFYYAAYTLHRIKISKKKIDWFHGEKIVMRICFLISIPVLFFVFDRIQLISIQTWLTWIIVAIAAVCVVGAVIAIYITFFEKAEFIYCWNHIKSSFKSTKTACYRNE